MAAVAIGRDRSRCGVVHSGSASPFQRARVRVRARLRGMKRHESSLYKSHRLHQPWVFYHTGYTNLRFVVVFVSLLGPVPPIKARRVLRFALLLGYILHLQGSFLYTYIEPTEVTQEGANNWGVFLQFIFTSCPAFLLLCSCPECFIARRVTNRRPFPR